MSPGKVAVCRVESFYTELHNLRLLLVNSATATAEDAWWLLVLHLSCLPPGGRQGGSYVHLTAGQWANVCGTCPGCLATRGSGQAENEAKKKENNRESGGCDAPGNVVDVVSRSEQIPNGAGLHTFPAQWNSLALLIIQGLRRAAGLTLCLQPHYQN